MNFIPYLTFNGQAEAAQLFYQGIFGGKLHIQRAKELFSDVTNPDIGNLVVHSVLDISPEFKITSLDVLPNAPRITPGNTVSMGLSFDSTEEGNIIFEKLSLNGKVIIPFEKKNWGLAFGVVEDQFGIRWNIDGNSD